jgi:hypothetical protein
MGYIIDINNMVNMVNMVYGHPILGILIPCQYKKTNSFLTMAHMENVGKMTPKFFIVVW